MRSRTTSESTGGAMSPVDGLVSSIRVFASGLGVRERIRFGERLAGLGEAIRVEAAAELVGADGDTRAARRALGSDKTSRRRARREAKRAAAAAKNSKIADEMASGGLSGEQVDAIADADRRTDGKASSDDGLIDRLAGASADETDKIVDDFVKDAADAGSVQAEHDRQRALRNVRKHAGRSGTGAVTIEGDQPSIDAMYAQLKSDANRLYQGDGGRDVPLIDHPRSRDQRLFDAAWARLTGRAPIETVDDDGRPVDVGNPIDAGGPGVAETTAPTRINSKRYTLPQARRPVMVITVSADKICGRAPGELAQLVGTGPIPDSVLAQILGDATMGVDLVGLVFGTDGQPLWLSRTQRAASDAQFLALVVRDGGCVQCGANWSDCEAHHLIPWNAPAKGETDIDKLALVCEPCHHELHDQLLTLYRDRTTGRWRTRPATPAETPPQRRKPQPDPGPTPEQLDLDQPEPRRNAA